MLNRIVFSLLTRWRERAAIRRHHGWEYPPLVQRLAGRLRLVHWDDPLDDEEDSDG